MLHGKSAKDIHTILIVSHVPHYQSDTVLYAYGPYAREIDSWADLFPQVQIAAPLRLRKPPGDCLAFTRPNIEILSQPERGGQTLGAKLSQVVSLPWMVYKLSVAMRRADAIQVRCPGNLGLLGVLLAPLFSRHRMAKYAGQWNGYKGEPFTYRLQRIILASRWWHSPVLVYGKWPNQPPHIVPFFTSVMDAPQLKRAAAKAAVRQLHCPIRILYVGRLTREKNVHVLLDAVGLLEQRGQAVEVRIVGDGPMGDRLQQQVVAMGLEPREVIIGALPFERVLEHYEWADVLVLASETEGWPKAIVEAMSFGLVCIGARRGLVPQMLADGRGLLVEPGDAAALASTLRDIAVGKVEFESISRAASTWAQPYSLDGLRNAIRDLLMREWGLIDTQLRAM